MSYSLDLIDSATKLLIGDKGPTKSDVNRAISTAYYAIFDCLASAVADQIAGAAKEDEGPTTLWLAVYRSLNHKPAAIALERYGKAVTHEHVDFANFALSFVALQKARLSADYDPSHSASLQEAADLIIRADQAISSMYFSPETWALHTDFLVDLCFPKRNNP